MKTFSFSASRVLFEHPLTLAAQGEPLLKVLLAALIRVSICGGGIISAKCIHVKLREGVITKRGHLLKLSLLGQKVFSLPRPAT